jgi:hypothetical protein
VSYRDCAREEDVLRGQLHDLVDDVEPRVDALPHVLAAARRRRSPRRRFVMASVAAVGVAATAVFLVTVFALPGQVPRGAEPVSVGPNSYLAEAEPGVIASFDVVSGRQLQQVARLSGRSAGVLAADGNHVYTVVVTGSGREIVEVLPNGEQRVVRGLPGDAQSPVLAARAGRVAFLDRDGVVVLRNGAEQRLPVPPGVRVLDLALDPDGRLAVLTAPVAPGPRGIHVVEPGAVSMSERPNIVPAGECGPLAIAWSGREVAALHPVDCASSRVRIATLDRASGEPIGAGVPFDSAPRRLDSGVRLSSDRLGRFLVGAADGRQWLVDGSDVRTVPPACSPSGACATAPGAFWGV